MESKETEIKNHIAKNAKSYVPKLLKVFNSLDGRCRSLCLSNPSRPMTDYCPKCQEMMKQILGDE